MSEEKFRKFLESQSRGSPVNRSEGFIFWENKGRPVPAGPPSDFLRSVYFGEELQDTVVMERSVAAMFQHQLGELEKENQHLRRRTRIFKIALAGVVLVLLLVISILLNTM